jgi:hypothetical protein
MPKTMSGHVFSKSHIQIEGFGGSIGRVDERLQPIDIEVDVFRGTGIELQMMMKDVDSSEQWIRIGFTMPAGAFWMVEKGRYRCDQFM